MRYVQITAAVLAAAIAGCSSGSSTSSAGGVAACTSLAPPKLAFPANGATGVAASGRIYFFYPSNPGQAFSAPVLTASNGGASATGSSYTTASSGLPAGMPPTPSGDQIFESDASLAASTTYTVAVTSSRCTNQSYTLGSFTTQ